MGSQVVVVVTGASRGIGKAICQAIATSIEKPLVIYATSRKGEDVGVASPSSNTKVKYSKLDISSGESIKTLASSIKEEHDYLDILVNNGAFHPGQQTTIDGAKKTLEVNYKGTLDTCQAFIPLMRKGGRIVNVSSTASGLKYYSMPIQESFRKANMTFQELNTLIEQYQTSVRQGTIKEDGWNTYPYSVSKACLNAATIILARENPHLLVNACCPGWVDTEMGSIAGNRPPKTAEEGARIPTRLAIGDVSSISGQYWANHSVFDSGFGDVQAW